jgi:hypothetical protein
MLKGKQEVERLLAEMDRQKAEEDREIAAADRQARSWTDVN